MRIPSQYKEELQTALGTQQAFGELTVANIISSSKFFESSWDLFILLE